MSLITLAEQMNTGK